MSLDDFSDDLLAIAGVNDDDDMTSTAAGCSDERRDALLPQQSMTTTAAATAKVKSAKTKATRSVVRRNERERNRVKQVNDISALSLKYSLFHSSEYLIHDNTDLTVINVRK